MEQQLQLEKQKNFANAIIDSSPDGIVGINEQGEIVIFNKQASLMFGYEKEEVLGKWLDILMPESYNVPHDVLIKQYFKNPQNRTMGDISRELIAIRKNGDHFPVDIALNYLNGENGMIALSSIRDISERKIAEKQKQVIEHNLNLAQKLAKLGSWEMNLENNILSWSDEVYRIFETEQNEFGASYEAFLDSIHPEDRELVNNAYSNSLKNKTAYKIEHRLLMKDGRVKFVEEQCETFYNDAGEPILSHGTVQDITERKIAESTIAESERQLKIAQRLAHIGSWDLDLITNITTWSEEQFIINGIPFTTQPITQEMFINLLHPEDKGWFMDKMNEAFAKGKQDSEYRIIRPDGAVRYLHGIAEVIYDSNGKPIRIFGTNQDITERKNAEEILQEKNKVLQKTNEELDRFVYSASHDLRAPLTSLLGLIDITEMDLQDGQIEMKERMEMMKKAVKKLDSFIEDILDYSRNARTEIVRELIDFKTKIKDIKEQQKFLEEGKRCNLKYQIECNAPFYSDRRRVSVILNNIISNAIKYSDESKAESIVKVQIATDKERATIIIEDNGIGIAEKNLEKVFEMFYRATNLSKGSGLGLYIVKENLEKLNGEIIVHSTPNIGTTIIIHIPNLL